MRKIEKLKGIKPLHYSMRDIEKFSIGDKAWIAFGPSQAIPVIVTEIDNVYYSVESELKSGKWKGGWSLRLDEVRSTPEKACLNHVTS